MQCTQYNDNLAYRRNSRTIQILHENTVKGVEHKFAGSLSWPSMNIFTGKVWVQFTDQGIMNMVLSDSNSVVSVYIILLYSPYNINNK